MNAIFYGFQFGHHGRSAGFWPLARAMKKHVRVIDATPPFNSQLKRRLQARVYHRWFPLQEYRLKHALSDNSSLCHYFFPENSLFRGANWKRPENKLVMTCHMPVKSDFFRLRHQARPGFVAGLKTAEAVILMAPNELAEYQAEAPQANVCFIPHGVDVCFFDPSSVEPSVKNRVFRVVTVGNCMRDYGVWANVVSSFSKTNIPCEFTVIANEQSIRQARNGLSVATERNVRFLRGISDDGLRQCYADADALFLPLENAWANNAVLEAMAMGVPMVTTDLPAVREYVGGQQAGAFYFENNQPDDAVNHLVALSKDPILRQRLGSLLREKAVLAYDWEKIAEQHVLLYKKVMRTA
jgi:glycosyltransferase involved in cell wall biosynthesis